MTRTQIQFPDPLYKELKQVAEKQDWSLAELLRRAAESYLQTLPRSPSKKKKWEFPVLPPSGGYLEDPAMICVEEEAVASRAVD